jgi:hypothetical protein
MANELVTKNLLSSHFGGADLALHRDVARLVELGGAPFISAMLIEFGCRCLVRSEIESLVAECILLTSASAGSA